MPEKKPYGRKKSYGDKPSYGAKKSYGDKPSYGAKKSYGDKPGYGEKKSYGDKPGYGERKTYGDKPGYGERKTYGDKPGYAESRGTGDRRPYGDKPAYGGERKPFQRKKYVAEVTNADTGPRDYSKRNTVQFRLDDDPLDQLQTLASERGIPAGALVREWVLERLQGGKVPAPARPAAAESGSATHSMEQRLSELEKRVGKLEEQPNE